MRPQRYSSEQPYLPRSCFRGSSVRFSSALQVNNFLDARCRHMIPRCQCLCPRRFGMACGLLTYYALLLCLVPRAVQVSTAPTCEAREERDWVDFHVAPHFKLLICCCKGYTHLENWSGLLTGLFQKRGLTQSSLKTT